MKANTFQVQIVQVATIPQSALATHHSQCVVVVVAAGVRSIATSNAVAITVAVVTA